MKTYRIHFIRNGITTGNLEGRYIGHTDEVLAPEGVNQIKNMDETMIYPYCDVVFSSPLKRCLQTAHIIYPDKEPIVINELIECNFGEFENKTADELNDSEDFLNWIKGGKDACPPHGESSEEFGKRVVKAFNNIVEGLIKTGTTDAVIVAHGGVIMTILSVFGFPEQDMTAWRAPGGCGYTMIVTPQIWSALKKGEVTAEIPQEKPGNDSENYENFDGNDDVSWNVLNLN